MDLDAKPELLETFDPAALSAARFWKSHVLNELADAGEAGDEEDFETMSIRINGGRAGLDARATIRGRDPRRNRCRCRQRLVGAPGGRIVAQDRARFLRLPAHLPPDPFSRCQLGSLAEHSPFVIALGHQARVRTNAANPLILGPSEKSRSKSVSHGEPLF
jgi:hypothetical protein